MLVKILYKAGIAQGMGLYGGREQLRHPTAPSTSGKQPAPCLASPRLATFGSLSSARFYFPLRWRALAWAVCASKPGSSFENALIFSLRLFFPKLTLGMEREMLNLKS